VKTWIVVISLAIVAVAVLSVAFFRSPGQRVEAAAVAVGEIREFVDEQGTTALPRTYVVTMPFEGRLEPISLSAGDRVKKGDPVAQIVPKDLAEEVELARTAVERLEAQIAENDAIAVELTQKRQAEYFVDSMDDTVQAAEARKTATAEKLQLAETTLGRLRRLLPQRAATQEQVEQAEVGLVEAQVDFQQSDLIWKSMASIKAATALLPTMISQQIANKDLSREVLAKQKAEAEVRLQQALTRQERGVMLSPVDGVVLERLVDNEQLLSGGAELLEMGRLEELQIEAEVLSQDVVRVEEGDLVEIYGPAVGAARGRRHSRPRRRRFTRRVSRKRSSLGVDQQRVIVDVELAGDALDALLRRGVRVGYRVRVRIFTDHKKNALLVPRSALFRGADGGWRVYLVIDGRTRLQPVTVGLMNDEIVEIVSGLERGATVILAPENTLTEGARVDSRD
jgi:HlyD family secretion protein